MKKSLLFFLALFPLVLFSQTEGTITYDEKIEVNIDSVFKGREQYRQYLTPEMMEMFKRMSSQKKTLLFNPHAAYYKDYEKPEEEGMPETEEGGGGGMGRWARMMNMRPMQLVYHDLDSMKAIEQQEFLEKKFLIKSAIEPRAWKLTTEQKKISGYDCTKATCKDSTAEVEAWFTMQIPVSSGPAGLGQLPGMILEATIKPIVKDTAGKNLSSDQGKVVITASVIELKPLKANAVTPPKQGKEVTREEYKKIVEEKLKEIRSMYGGQGSGGGRTH
jgi:GLPGLI family protein